MAPKLKRFREIFKKQHVDLYGANGKFDDPAYRAAYARKHNPLNLETGLYHKSLTRDITSVRDCKINNSWVVFGPGKPGEHQDYVLGPDGRKTCIDWIDNLPQVSLHKPRVSYLEDYDIKSFDPISHANATKQNENTTKQNDTPPLDPDDDDVFCYAVGSEHPELKCECGLFNIFSKHL